jgi:FAD binding domain
MVEAYEGYKTERKADDSDVKFKYSDGVVETYDFSNIMDEKFLYNQVQKDRAPKDYPIEIGGYRTWPCTAQFQGPVVRREVGRFITVLRWFEKYTMQKAKDNGADWYYQHKAIVLTQDAGGVVTGAIVEDKAGKYIQFNARKGVIVATGDFSGNIDMCWALLNEAVEWMERSGISKKDYKSVLSITRDGQGHKMCCWAGGMIEPSPRGCISGGGGAIGPWGIGPMLQLNAKARRYGNEAAAPLIGQAALRQPRGIISLVTDRKYIQSVVVAGLEHGGPNFGRKEWFEDMQEDMSKVLAAGAKGYPVRGIIVAERSGATVFGANTLEKLAGYLGYTGDLVKTFIESINRYNDLCRKGVDSDFGKDSKAMIPIDEAPFYGCASEGFGAPGFGLATLAGLVTDTRLRVLDKSGIPIRGLGRYGLGYSTPFAGNSIGMAMTHGWMAGKFAAEL